MRATITAIETSQGVSVGTAEFHLEMGGEPAKDRLLLLHFLLGRHIDLLLLQLGRWRRVMESASLLRQSN